MDRQQLIDIYGDPLSICNGTVVRIYKEALVEKNGTSVGIERVMVWAGQEGSFDATRMKIKRMMMKLVKERGEAKKKLEEEIFEFPEPRPVVQTEANLPVPAYVEEHSASGTNVTSLPKSPQKQVNFMQHQINKKEKHLGQLKAKIDAAKQELVELNKRKGHYSVSNVNKREARNLATQKALRAHRREYSTKCSQLKAENEKLQGEISTMETERECLKKKVVALEKETCLKEMCMTEMKDKQRRAEKRASFHKISKQRLEVKLKQMEQAAVAEDDNDDERVRHLETKDEGKYIESLRVCVMELAALEVATGKMAKVIESVAHVCRTKCSHLPSRKTCQNMLDQGQYIAQRIIGDKVKVSGGIGIHKDGTTRRKVKILDSTISFEDGSTRSMGFSAVASETGEAIAERTQEKMKEIATAVEEEGFEVDMVEKLSYFMNDRAGNEKKSSRLLEEWRNNMLAEQGMEKGRVIRVRYCTAHVLIGFQTYVLKSLNDLNSGQAKHPLLLLLRDAADLFGPVGDYRGCRNIWEGFCIEKGIKSTIQNFKDNRFNGLFEVSAQVYHHHRDFLTILSKSSNNAKQQRLQKALENKDLINTVHILGLFFFKITGPFWTFAVSKSEITELPQFIQNLKFSLESISQDPNIILQRSFDFLEKYKTTSTAAALGSVFTEKDANPTSLKRIKDISAAMKKTLETQMPDMLEGGKYGSKEGAESLRTASFAPLNNLSCERNFGMLDAGWRRRPSSSFHHLTSLIMLKENRSQLRSFCRQMSISQRKVMWAKAVIMGKTLREKQRENDKGVLMTSVNNAFPKRRKLAQTKTSNSKTKRRPNTTLESSSLPTPPDVKIDELVAVACEDHWYPGKWIITFKDSAIILTSFSCYFLELSIISDGNF